MESAIVLFLLGMNLYFDDGDITYLLENNLSSIERLLAKVSDDESVQTCMKNIRQEVINLKNRNLPQNDKIKFTDTIKETENNIKITKKCTSKYDLFKKNETVKYDGTNEMKQNFSINNSISGHAEHIKYLNNVPNSLRIDSPQRSSKLSINEQKKLSILENISYVGGLLQEHKIFQNSVVKNTNAIETKRDLYIDTSCQDQDEYQNYSEMSNSTDEHVIDDRLSSDSSHDGVKGEVFCASNGRPIFLSSNDILEDYWLQGPIIGQEDGMNSSFNTILREGNDKLKYQKYYTPENIDSIEDGVEICP